MDKWRDILNKYLQTLTLITSSISLNTVLRWRDERLRRKFLIHFVCVRFLGTASTCLTTFTNSNSSIPLKPIANNAARNSSILPTCRNTTRSLRLVNMERKHTLYRFSSHKMLHIVGYHRSYIDAMDLLRFMTDFYRISSTFPFHIGCHRSKNHSR